MPPSFRFADAMALVSDVRGLEQLVSQGERDVVQWRARMFASMRSAFDKINMVAAGYPKEVVSASLLPVLDGLLAKLHETSRGLRTPFSDHPKVKEALGQINRVGGPPARHLRTLFRRADDIRLRYLGTYDDAFFELVAFRASLDPETDGSGPHVTNAEELEALFARLDAE